MPDHSEKAMRKELIEDYFLEISDLIGSEKMQTEIELEDEDLYTAKVDLDLYGISEEQQWDHICTGLRSIIRRINTLEKSPNIKLSLELSGLFRNK